MSNTAVFGKRKEPHTIIFARGDRISHFTIRPWVAALGAAVLAAIAVGYLLATSYLMLRDDILNAAIARQARMQYAYEDRIAALRTQVDRITSYRLLDQQIMEMKVAELLTRQSVLAKRSGRLAPLLEKAETNGIAPQTSRLDPTQIPVPASGGATDNAARTLFRSQKPIRAGIETTAANSRQANDALETTPILALSRLGASLNHLESDQLNQISTLAASARSMRKQIVADARRAGLPLSVPTVKTTGTGGPFIPASGTAFGQTFDAELATLNNELDALDKVRGAIMTFPIANPAPGNSVTSGFGNRRDPIIGKSAFHAGIDLSTPSGTGVRAAGSGTVIKAGRNSGYGNMIEIRHANGLSTRYAHLSRILVKTGQKVVAGALIGKSGSTGRSTGPHLHYEVRQRGKAINPLTFLKAGTRLRQYL